MKKSFILIVLLSSFLFSTAMASEEKAKNENSDLKQKNIEKQLKKEKKFSKEQRFYKGKNYDLKSAEVDEKSVDSLPDVENTNADFDMDSVYD